MKPTDVKPSTYIESSIKINYEDPKFKTGDIVRISNYKNLFAKGYAPNWSEEVVIEKVKNAVVQANVISDLKVIKEIVVTFFKKEFQKTNQKEFRVEKIIKKKGDKLYVKWKPMIGLLAVGFMKKA